MEQTSEKPPEVGADGTGAAVNMPDVGEGKGASAAVSEPVSPDLVEKPEPEQAIQSSVDASPGAGVRPIEETSRPRGRRVMLPIILFVATCLSTFFVGMTGWDFLAMITEPVEMFRRNGWQGATYMVAVMGILLAHEMGHFLQAVRYGVPASLPWFIPLPITPLGTMGAVIALGGSQADRKQLFDIGLTGPLAGLVIALPLTYIGLLTATPFPASSDASLGGMHFGDPLIFKILVAWLRPDLPPDSRLIVFANPLVVAGWVGMLVTGLNMLPIGQLDGGHVAYALMGRRAYWLARAMVLVTIAFVLLAAQYGWLVMLALVIFLGIRHPPTADDRVELGRGRTILGWLSLLIPLFCFPPFPLVPSLPAQ